MQTKLKKEAVPLILSALLVITAGCGKSELESISVQSGPMGLIITAGLSGETGYSLSAGSDDDSLILLVPDAELSNIIPGERLIGGNDMISGWFARKVGDDLEVKFYLTAQYAFSHSAAPDPAVDGKLTVRILVDNPNAPPPVAADNAETGKRDAGTPLSRGMALFNSQAYDDALDEFNTAVSENERCPLAYYYAARIRLEKEQYSRALTNFRVALRDSAAFTDAVGFLAYTLNKTGKTEEAQREWKRFTAEVGKNDDNAGAAADVSGMHPERYRENLERLKKEEVDKLRLAAMKKEAERLAQEKRESEKVKTVETAEAVEAVEADTLSVETAAAEIPAAQPDSVIAVAGITGTVEQMDEIDNRIRSDIKKGIYGIIAAVIILTVGIGGSTYWIRKRNAPRIDLTFSDEVRNMIAKQEESVGEEIEEERTVRDYEVRRKAIEPVPPVAPEPPPLQMAYEEPEPSAAISETENQAPDASFRHFLENSSGRQTITEEIKALVMRMHREGRSTAEICRASDLTKTEVELIIAVRTKHIEQLIEDVSDEDDDGLDTDNLYIAINELKEDGDSTREIAKKLGISTSEINLALAVMNAGKNS